MKSFEIAAYFVCFRRQFIKCAVPEIAQYGPYYFPLNVSVLPNDQTFIFYLLLLKLALFNVAAV